MTTVSIVIPTRGRLAYLEVALASIAPAAAAADAEIVVVDDGDDVRVDDDIGAGDRTDGRDGSGEEAATTPALAERFGARYEPHPRPLGLNAARNTGVERSGGELVVFVDDDVRVSPGWLGALLRAASARPDVDVFTGPIGASLEGPAPRSCGREQPPITTLELGEQDVETGFAWGANMAIRRSALERVGAFDVSLAGGGDEQEWQERLRAKTPGAKVLYVAGARVAHRRVGADARLRALARTAHERGRAARRFDARRGAAPTLAREIVTIAGCTSHVVRRACPAGITMVAHSAGRIREAVRGRRLHAPQEPRLHAAQEPRPHAPQEPWLRAATHERPAGGVPRGRAGGEDFLSGESGTVGGVRSRARAGADRAIDAWELASGGRLRLARAAHGSPPRRRVLALGVERPQHRALAAAIRVELGRSRHEVELHTTAPRDRGKFEALGELLASHPAAGHDWLLIVDDDVELPRGFLDRFLFVCERFSFSLAQPAHRLDSHAAWSVTRRRPGSVARETSFVEIGPVTAFARATFPVLLPFPALRMGWGLDVHWAALARAHEWRCGVIDAVAIRHRAAPAAAGYDRSDAVEEARAFLADRPYVRAADAQRTLATHRGW